MKISLNKNVIIKDYETKGLLIDVERADYRKVNSSGLTISKFLNKYGEISVEELLLKLSDLYELPEEVFGEEVQQFLDDMIEKGFFVIGYCGFGIYSLYIDSFGKIILCPLLGNIQLGTITDGIENIWENSKILMEYRSHTIADIEKCNTCKNVNVCKGGCRARAYFINGSILACDPVSCKMY
ncbi:SPASM domain-containing protein [Dorea longicatena]|uniref:PqqD family peptide modification chaperone n=1 Tax=Dorea longicatena TaxID=88431 RepID=UPI00156FA497|nr:PqqD family peptide modification chaperone [Dorea longicatena]NSE36493.1 SPASM domain-containing protein [Dorea longicatena]